MRLDLARDLTEYTTDLEVLCYLMRDLSKMDECPNFVKGSHMEEIVNEAEIAALPPDVKAAYEMELVEGYDEWAKLEAREVIGKKKGLAEGRAEGLAEGEAKGRAETAKNLLALGVDIQTVSKATNLSIEELESLQK